MPITMKEIAELAGVSKTTVSKVINNKDHNISKATKDKILNIVKEKNYVPNKLAQGLVTKRTNNIGLIIPDIGNPFFTDISKGVEHYARGKGYNVVFANSDENFENEVQSMEMLIENRVDGIILAPSSNTSNEDKTYENIKVPLVLVDKNIEALNKKGLIKVDNKNGVHEATKHLIDLGHKKILYISGPLKNEIATQRLEGYISALEENDITINKENIIEGQYKREWAYDFIKANKNLDFTAICCANDLIAIGIIQGLLENNIKVPDQISVIGFDDIQTCKLISPSLTTIRQPAFEMGKKASEILINYLENKDNKNHKEDEEMKVFNFKPELIIRESSKARGND